MRCHLPALDLHIGHLLHAAARLMAAHPTAASLLIAVPLLAVPLLFWAEGLGRRRARRSAAGLGAPRPAAPARPGRTRMLPSH